MIRTTFILAAFMLAHGYIACAEERAEIVVYGATPAGIAAAISAAKSGRSVLLLEPARNIGGLVTNGLSHTDFRTFEGITGTFHQFNARVKQYYIDKYGADSPQAKGCFRGTHAEPHVNLEVFEKMIAEHAPRIRVFKTHRLVSVQFAGDRKRITSATFTNSEGQTRVCTAEIFIDGTYEGDLMAQAGVKYAVGREGRDVYNESRAPEQSDAQLQGYNFRLIMTRNPGNRVAPTEPIGYKREEFLDVLPLLQNGKIKTVFCTWRGGMFKAQQPPLPNEKFDINDVSHEVVRLSLPGENAKWPDGDAAVRQQIFDVHLRHNVGLIYFLQNDEAVPEAFRKEAREWGWCKDEFTGNGHIPEQLYVREARRMIGAYVFKEQDTDYAQGDARAVFQKDSIAMGDYGPNCHGTGHEGPRFGGKHTGEFYKAVAGYQIPYGVMLPQSIANLLVPVACSSSHVGFCALRLEPIWASLGQAAGFTAHIAIKENVPVQRVDISCLQKLLHQDGAATIYVADVLPDHPDFAAVQWWGSVGGLHGLYGLYPPPEKLGERGALIAGQYFKAFPGHAAELEKLLDEKTQVRWQELARVLGISAEGVTPAKTRGEFIRKAFSAVRKP